MLPEEVVPKDGVCELCPDTNGEDPNAGVGAAPAPNAGPVANIDVVVELAAGVTPNAGAAVDVDPPKRFGLEVPNGWELPMKLVLAVVANAGVAAAAAVVDAVEEVIPKAGVVAAAAEDEPKMEPVAAA